MSLHTRLNLSLRAFTYGLDVCTIICRCTRVCQELTHQIWIACILVFTKIVSQRQWYEPYKHVYVLRDDSPRDARCKPLKYQALKPIYLMVHLLPIINNS